MSCLLGESKLLLGTSLAALFLNFLKAGFLGDARIQLGHTFIQAYIPIISPASRYSMCLFRCLGIQEFFASPHFFVYSEC